MASGLLQLARRFYISRFLIVVPVRGMIVAFFSRARKERLLPFLRAGMHIAVTFPDLLQGLHPPHEYILFCIYSSST